MYNEHYKDDYDIQSDAERCFTNSPYTPVRGNDDHNWYEEPFQITDYPHTIEASNSILEFMPAKYESEWESLQNCDMQQHQKIYSSKYENEYESLFGIYPPAGSFQIAVKSQDRTKVIFNPMITPTTPMTIYKNNNLKVQPIPYILFAKYNQSVFLTPKYCSLLSNLCNT